MATLRSNLVEHAEAVRSKEDLIGFVHELIRDLHTHPGEWENASLERYLEALAAWAGDMDGYYRNRGEAPPEMNWKVLGQLLLAAKSYE